MTVAGKVVLITGSTDGVGRMTAERLGKLGAVVLVHGRDAERGNAVVQTVRSGGGEADFYPANLASLAEVRALARSIGRRGDLDVLVNNAGVGTGGASGGRDESVDGFELRFAVNYLAGFLLTRLLLPTLLAADSPRIVNVSSLGQQAIDFDDVMLERGYSGARAYCQSKLAQIMFTIDLADELKASSITSNALHPATYMNTTMVRQSGVPPMSTVDQGCDAIMNLVVGEDGAKHSGEFFNGLLRSRADAQAYNKAARQRLRTLSYELTGFASSLATGGTIA